MEAPLCEISSQIPRRGVHRLYKAPWQMNCSLPDDVVSIPLTPLLAVVQYNILRTTLRGYGRPARIPFQAWIHLVAACGRSQQWALLRRSRSGRACLVILRQQMKMRNRTNEPAITNDVVEGNI